VPRLGRNAKPGRRVALRVKIDDQHLLANRGQRGAKIDRRRCLTDATLLIGDRQNSHCVRSHGLQAS
jgi:hypothetical protein